MTADQVSLAKSFLQLNLCFKMLSVNESDTLWMTDMWVSSQTKIAI